MDEIKPTIETTPPTVSREQLRDPGFLREQWQNLRLIWRLFRDPDVPIYLKLIPFSAILYLILPIDLLPDMFVGLGQMDDLALLMLGAKTFTTLAPQHVVAAHREALRREDSGMLTLPDKALEQVIVIEPDKSKW